MLAQPRLGIKGLDKENMQRVKDKVYNNLLDFLLAEGYPSGSTEDFKEANVTDLTLLIVLPVITTLKRVTKRNLDLRREKHLISPDRKTHGYQEFVGIDVVRIGERKFVFVVEAKKTDLGLAKKHCFLALKDMQANNGGGTVYGFVTTGEHWQMVSYDGQAFIQTERLQVVYPGMKEDGEEDQKKKWMDGFSQIVDCIHRALCDGGFGG